jgi:hypothetical protein
VLLIMGALYQYWYVAIPLGVIVLGGLWWNRNRQQEVAVTQPPGAPTPEAAISQPAPPSAQAGWRTDPTGRHEQRYWDGAGWTDNVSDRGTASRDRL